jgi:hypothetical protein
VIRFEKYPHVQDLFEYYLKQQGRDDVKEILQVGVKTENDAELISRFAWKMAEMINDDEANGIEVFGRTDNTDMLPDLSYEMTRYMKSVGYYSIWKKVSEEEMT